MESIPWFWDVSATRPGTTTTRHLINNNRSHLRTAQNVPTTDPTRQHLTRADHATDTVPSYRCPLVCMRVLAPRQVLHPNLMQRPGHKKITRCNNWLIISIHLSCKICRRFRPAKPILATPPTQPLLLARSATSTRARRHWSLPQAHIAFPPVNLPTRGNRINKSPQQPHRIQQVIFRYLSQRC